MRFQSTSTGILIVLSAALLASLADAGSSYLSGFVLFGSHNREKQAAVGRLIMPSPASEDDFFQFDRNELQSSRRISFDSQDYAYLLPSLQDNSTACSIANNGCAPKNVLPSRTSLYDSDRPKLDRTDKDGKLVMYHVPVETAVDSYHMEDGNESQLQIERKLVPTGSSTNAHAVIGGRASRDMRMRKGPHPTVVTAQVSSSDLQTDANMLTTQETATAKGHDAQQRLPRITHSPRADIDAGTVYYEYDDSTVIIDRDSIILVRLYSYLDLLASTVDAVRTEFEHSAVSGLASKAHVRIFDDLQATKSTLQSWKKSVQSRDYDFALEDVVSSISSTVSRYPICTMLLALFFVMCFL
ncbi:hypothetical protein BZA70DRAFT_172649 [Myxozyma melibiosi]|uniref:Uncharacterized protein n=1 Tax=Myxozyma melibiosi TaxID=54550 RepID=A0ABR1F7N2_9ASCO